MFGLMTVTSFTNVKVSIYNDDATLFCLSWEHYGAHYHVWKKLRATAAKQSRYSITSSATASSVISKPSASDFFEGAIAWMGLTGEIVTSKPACFRNSAGRL